MKQFKDELQFVEDQEQSLIDQEMSTKAHSLESDFQQNFDFENDKFPFSIVWTTLPLISWILPFIGHTGICTSDGKVHDFAGPYNIGIDNLAFGRPLKYVPLNSENLITTQKWNEGVYKADKIYEKRMHNLCCDNCHSHVANALNQMKYKGKENWNMISIWLLCLTHSKYVSFAAFFKTYIGFIVLVMVFMLFL